MRCLLRLLLMRAFYAGFFLCGTSCGIFLYQSFFVPVIRKAALYKSSETAPYQFSVLDTQISSQKYLFDSAFSSFPRMDCNQHSLPVRLSSEAFSFGINDGDVIAALSQLPGHRIKPVKPGRIFRQCHESMHPGEIPPSAFGKDQIASSSQPRKSARNFCKIVSSVPFCFSVKLQ